MMVRERVQLVIRQEPKRAQVVQESNPKNRKPIDPPPIIELKYNDENDINNAQWLVSPRTFMMVSLIPAQEEHETAPGKMLIGQTVSSLHRLKDITNKDGGFFVFGDISAKRTGKFKLRFSLFDANKETEEVEFLGVIDSAVFPVVAQRDFGSMSESTHLTRTFSDQGVKLRVRKDNRSIAGVKRSYNGTPPDTTSPSVPSNAVGTVADYQYSTSNQDTAVKRQRSSGSYDSTLYAHSAVLDTPSSNYTSTMPSNNARYSMSNDYPRSYGSFQQYSPGAMAMTSRNSSMQSTGWQGMQQTSALPSPTSSVSGQQHNPYSTAPATQQASAMFGDPGSASAIPRNSYSGSAFSYEHSGAAPYAGNTSPDHHHNPYPQLQMAGSSLSDGASGQANPYSTAYLPSNNLYGSEAPEASSVPYVYAEARPSAF